MNYYVYAYLRKKDNTPYYIGKGKNSRALYQHDHLVSVPKDKKQIAFWHKNLLNEKDALNLEKAYIKLYGRKDQGTGILLNRTDGGDQPPSWKGKRRPARTLQQKQHHIKMMKKHNTILIKKCIHCMQTFHVNVLTRQPDIRKVKQQYCSKTCSRQSKIRSQKISKTMLERFGHV